MAAATPANNPNQAKATVTAPGTPVPAAPAGPRLSPKTLAEQEAGRNRLKLYGNP